MSSTLTTPTISPESSVTHKRDLLSAARYLDGKGLQLYNYASTIHSNALGRGLEFHNVPWLAEIYADPAPNKVIRKSSQVGITEYALVSLRFFAQAGLTGMYILPTDNFRDQFMRERFQPMVAANDELVENIGSSKKSADAMTVKIIYGVPWKFVGARNRKNFFGFPADVLLGDEFDLCDQTNLAYAEDRQGRSANPHYYKFGNPSLPGYGIDSEYEASDKKEWLVKCPACNTWQTLTWWKNVVRQTGERIYELRDPGFSSTLDPATIDYTGRDARVYCEASRCQRPINRLLRGAWVQQYPDRLVSGYAVAKIFGDPRARAIILEMFFGKMGFLNALDNWDLLERFYNSLLGEPFRAPGSALTAEILEKCVGDFRLPEVPREIDGQLVETYAGADVGSNHHIQIESIDPETKKRRKEYIGRVSSFEELGDLVDLWNVQVGVIDCRPETEKAREFVENRPGWYLCEYPPNSKIRGHFKIDEINQWIQADRTQTLDADYRDHARREILLPLDFMSADGGDYVEHLEASVRKLVERGNLVKTLEYIWDEGNKPDHHKHASNYCRIAGKIYESGPILEIV